MEYKQNLINELKSIFKIGKAKRHWAIPVMASLCVGLPLLIGYFLDNFSASLTVSLGGLVILYLPTEANLLGRVSKLLLCSFGFVFSYLIGIFFSFNYCISYIVFGIFSTIVYIITKKVKLNPPGTFFFILIAAMASGIPFSLGEIPYRIGLMTLGVFFSCFIAFLFSLLFIKSDIKSEAKNILSNIDIQDNIDYLEAIIIGIFMSLSFFIAHMFGLNNPYWVPISCLAVMQGVNAKHIWQRGFYRVLGTTLGMILCWFILSFLKTPLEIIISIMIFQYIIELLVVKNYFYAVLFITPMTVLLSEAGHPNSIDPNLLILARLKDVFLGSTFGAFGGWILYNEKFRYQIKKHIQIKTKK
ncbi:FUSC family protein [Chishuiella sp.]|uniref:FUSC family protein n=1 Tax=Chishuiella sp. TaxID=1969467 RepID=UPI0028ABC6DA|nr:FUSC family protein [Chishuiella sp.]